MFRYCRCVYNGTRPTTLAFASSEYVRSSLSPLMLFSVNAPPIFLCTAGGQGLGYAGISNMLAVEFDTYYNAEMLEPYENHVSVQTRCGQLSSSLVVQVAGSVVCEDTRARTVFS